jgi:hypothetical protein
MNFWSLDFETLKADIAQQHNPQRVKAKHPQAKAASPATSGKPRAVPTAGGVRRNLELPTSLHLDFIAHGGNKKKAKINL